MSIKGYGGIERKRNLKKRRTPNGKQTKFPRSQVDVSDNNKYSNGDGACKQRVKMNE